MITQAFLTTHGLTPEAADYVLRELRREIRNDVIEECAVAAEAQDRIGLEWVRDSLWAAILKRAGINVRRLKD